jgi:hypothetical protein
MAMTKQKLADEKAYRAGDMSENCCEMGGGYKGSASRCGIPACSRITSGDTTISSVD